MFRLFFVFFVFSAGCLLGVCNLFRMLWQSVRNVVAICSPRIRNPFRIHSRNVRNVFVICVLHIRHAKVWFLRRKSMVFSVQNPLFTLQKGSFWYAKRGFFVFRYNGRRFCRCWKTVLLCRGCGLSHCNFYAIVLV